MTGSSRLVAFLLLGRPHFLPGGLMLYASGAAAARYLGHRFDSHVFFWGLACVIAIQWMTHYSNDYYDQAADAANSTPTLWSGGSQVLVRGDLEPTVALRAAMSFALVAVATALLLAFHLGTGPLTLPLVAVGLALAWAYSAPPWRLHSRGLGELTAGLVVGALTPLTGYYLQADRLEWPMLLGAVQLLLVGFVMILTVHFPDAIGDAAVGKRTLVVRLGGARAARLHNTVLGASYLALIPLAAVGLPAAVAIATCATAPLAAVQMWSLHRKAWLDPRRFSGLTFRAVAILGLAGTSHLLGYLLAT